MVSEVQVRGFRFHPSAGAPLFPPLESPFRNPVPLERREGIRSSPEPLPIEATFDGENRPGRVP